MEVLPVKITNKQYIYIELLFWPEIALNIRAVFQFFYVMNETHHYKIGLFDSLAFNKRDTILTNRRTFALLIRCTKLFINRGFYGKLFLFLTISDTGWLA